MTVVSNDTLGRLTTMESNDQQLEGRGEHKVKSITASMRTAFVAVLFLFATVVRADVWTASLPISKINFDGTSNSGTVYVQTPSSNWSVPGCANTEYVMVRDIPGVKQMLALVIAAKAQGSKVSFSGTCYSAGYFFATYISVE
jgi:hypothetical protein